MNAERKLPKVAASSSQRSMSDLYQAMARSTAAIASGTPARIRSRTSAVSGQATPPGTIPSGWIRLPASHSMICWPHLRSPMPSLASRGFARATPMMLRTAGSASNPKRRSGDERWKNDRAFDWTIWPRLMTRRRSAPVGVGSTAMMSSTALADATRWLTGQIPQMRAMSAGISWTGRPWVMRSKPRNWVTWKWASATSPRSSSWIVILEWPSIRVTGSMTMVRLMAVPRQRPNRAPAASGTRPASRSSSMVKMRSA